MTIGLHVPQNKGHQECTKQRCWQEQFIFSLFGTQKTTRKHAIKKINDVS